MTKKLDQFFSKETISSFARLSKFQVIESKLKPEAFIKAQLFKETDEGKLSLKGMTTLLSDNFDCKVTKQSLDERFTKRSVKFVMMLISKVLLDYSVSSVKDEKLFKYFEEIYVGDSTNIQLPKALALDYGGSGGAASGALARIQFEYGLKAMSINQFELTKGDCQDATYAKNNLEKLVKGALYIRDLGYVSKEYMDGVIKANAFFLNKIRPNQTLYTKDNSGQYVELSFKNLSREFAKKEEGFHELDAFIKNREDYIAIRLLLEKVPEAVYKQRIKAYKKKYKNKREPGENYKYRNRFNILATNASREMLSPEAANALYSMRWQVELIFKAWKSVLKVAELKDVKKERLETQLLIKLLLIAITWQPYQLANKLVKETAKRPFHAVSYYKYFQRVLQLRSKFLEAARQGGTKLKNFIIKLVNDIASDKDYWVELKKNSRSKATVETINALYFN